MNVRCPRCKSEMIRATAIANAPSEFWLACPRCNTYVNTYRPQPHQAALHADPHLYIGNFGGYGTGKTLTSRQEIYKHIFLTPNANILICANISAQYEQTLKRDMEMDLPAAFIKNINTQKSYWDFINGARIMFRPLDDPDKLRSLNLSMFVIVEASEVSPDSFQQLKTRTRNLAASVPVTDDEGHIVCDTLDNGTEVPKVKCEWRKGIIESNPDSGWVRTDVLLVSDDIQKHGHVLDNIKVPDDIKDKAISSHVSSTDTNAYLPKNFIPELCKNKPTWWVNRYVFSSFNYAEGLVYPSAGNHFIPSFEIPPTWKRLIAADYGLSDDFVYLYAAVDPVHGIVHIYKEVRTNNKSIDELAKLYFENKKDIPEGAMYCAPILDPKSGPKRDYDKKSLYDHFLDHGIAFIPGAVSVEARVFRVNTYLEAGRIKIHDCCIGLRAELLDYKFPPKKLGVYTKAMDKPEDKNNHAINPLEWICMALPHDPKNLVYGVYDRFGADITLPADEQEIIPWQLADEKETEEGTYL